MATALPLSQSTHIYPSTLPTGGESTACTMQEAAGGIGRYDRRDAFKCMLVISERRQ